MYNTVESLELANNLLVRGKDGNIEIVAIQDMT
jgi:hypothetical protein